MVRTISKMFLKKRFFSLLTSLTCEHCIFPALTTGYFIVFPRSLFACFIYFFRVLVICYVHSRSLVSLCRPWHAFPASLVAFFTPTSLATSQFFQRLLYLCHCCSIFPPLYVCASQLSCFVFPCSTISNWLLCCRCKSSHIVKKLLMAQLRWCYLVFRDTCIVLLKSLPSCENLLFKSCARCQGTVTEVNELHEKVTGNCENDECF